MSAPGSGGPEELVVKTLTNMGGGGAAAAIFVLLAKVLPSYFNGTASDGKAMRDELREQLDRCHQDIKDLRQEMINQKSQHQEEIAKLRADHDAEISKLRQDYEVKVAELTAKLDGHSSRFTRVYAERAAARATVNALEVRLQMEVTAWPPDTDEE